MVNTTEEFVGRVTLSSVAHHGSSAGSISIPFTQFLMIAAVLASLEDRDMCVCVCVCVFSSGLAYI